MNSEFCCLNVNDCPTYFSNTHNIFSSVDISLCTADIVEKFEWGVCEDSYSSDHFPIILKYLENPLIPSPPRYNFQKADWDKYILHTRNIPPFPHHQDFNVMCDDFTDFIINSANKSIPKSNPHALKSSVPWWSPNLTNLIKVKHMLSRQLHRLTKRFKVLWNLPLTTKRLISIVKTSISISCIKPLYNKYNAKFRKAVIAGKISSWRAYVSNISNNTSMRDMWHKLRKINGSYIRSR